MRAVVIFSDGDHPPKWWHRLLAPGRRHVECFLEMWPEVTQEGSFVPATFPALWVGVAGGCGDLFVLPMPEGFDPHAFAAERGLTAVETAAAPKNGGWRLVGRTDCTAVVKLAIGLRDWRILTPRQLHARLTREVP